MKKQRKQARKVKRAKRRTALGSGRIVECIFDCPAKGRVEVRLWARKRETVEDTCHRALRERVRIDRPQIQLCRKVQFKPLD